MNVDTAGSRSRAHTPTPSRANSPRAAALQRDLQARVSTAYRAMLGALVDAGANISAVDTQSRAGGGGNRYTPLHWAIIGNGKATGEGDDAAASEDAAWALLRSGAQVLAVRLVGAEVS